jgi:hypothetical protein
MAELLADDFSPLALRWRAEVRVDGWLPRGEVEVCRADRLIGLAAPAMPDVGGDAPKRGKESSSKSGSRRADSKQRPVVDLPTSMGRLNQGNWRSLPGFLMGSVAETGVTGVVSLEGNCDKSLVGDGE